MNKILGIFRVDRIYGGNEEGRRRTNGEPDPARSPRTGENVMTLFLLPDLQWAAFDHKKNNYTAFSKQAYKHVGWAMGTMRVPLEAFLDENETAGNEREAGMRSGRE